MKTKSLKYLSQIALSLNCGVSLLHTIKTIGDETGIEQWINIHKLLLSGDTFSEALSKNPLPGLTLDDHKVLSKFVYAGELGGVLEIVLNRYLEAALHPETNNTVTNFIRLFATLLSSGVPVLQAVSSTPTECDITKTLQTELIHDLKEGGSVVPAFEKAIGKLQSVIINAGEQTGALPEVLLSLADWRQEWTH